MRAARLVSRRRIEVVSMPRPEPRAGEALVRVLAAGVCRSDIHYFLHGRISNQVIRRYPQTLGHEAAGVVEMTGAGVRGLKPGDRVAIEPAVPCGRCEYCMSGHGNVCSKVRFLGMPGLPGAFAEYLAMPAKALFRIPRDVSFAQAAALEPMAIGMHAVRLMRHKTPRTALVVGAGPIGLSALAALKLKPTRVTVCDYLPERLRIARRMGANAVFRVRRGAPMRKAAERLGRYDAVVEGGGTGEAVELALLAARPCAEVALIGIPDAETVRVNLHVARRKELAIHNVRRSNEELPDCIRLLSAGRLKLSPMLTHSGGLSAAQRIFEMVAGYRRGVVKALILPWER